MPVGVPHHRFQLAAGALDPNVEIIAPWRMEKFRAKFPGRTEMIEYETSDGRWHSETAAGNDRPETEVEG